jgi:hypothetical protein
MCPHSESLWLEDMMKRLLLVLCVLVAFVAQANALSITPSTGTMGVNEWTGPQTSNSAALAAIAAYIGSAQELYKNNVGGAEEKTLAGSYETTFLGSAGDTSGATITYTGGNIVGPTAYLFVKDGSGPPAWYLFNLTAFGWDGMATLDLSEFWQGVNGAISHVSLFGNNTPVPEPATMLLLGAGLIGLAGYGRKKLI